MSPSLRIVISGILFLLISHRFGYSQPLSFERIATPSSHVIEFDQDKRGFIWFGGDGLHRYDGYEFESYYRNPDDSISISSNVITSILVDSHGIIWIGTGSNPWPLNEYDPVTESFKRYQLGEATRDGSNTSIAAMYEDGVGAIWISTTSGELYNYNRDTNSFSMYNVPGVSRFVQSILERNGGILLPICPAFSELLI